MLREGAGGAGDFHLFLILVPARSQRHQLPDIEAC
jgi:hypothetical protein